MLLTLIFRKHLVARVQQLFGLVAGRRTQKLVIKLFDVRIVVGAAQLVGVVLAVQSRGPKLMKKEPSGILFYPNLVRQLDRRNSV